MQQTTSARTEPVTEPGEHYARTYGQYTVVLSLPVDGGFAINTYAATGSHRYAELSFTVGDADTGNLAHRIIKTGGEQGVSPAGIREALTDALVRELHEVQARRDAESRTRIEHINALLDHLESPADTAKVAELAEQVRRNLTDTVPAGQQPQITRSRSGVEHKPLSVPMQRALNAHVNGIVYPDTRVVRATLRALAGRGLGTLHFEGTRKRIVSLELNKQGHNAVKAVAR
ncbi:hypothetical protein [Micromonospora sp. NBC_00421]|uniref:hypothetical protein n=1 Tax=Micromonospora sp. NBC_00421 TaxID=2975976 RepID=UPI002E1C53C8